MGGSNYLHRLAGLLIRSILCAVIVCPARAQATGAGGHPKITEESLSDALVAFTLP